MHYPKITIITPSYNQGHFLEETIRSVVGQNYSDMEYFVIDGGSTDNSINIIKKHEKYISYWVSENDGGQTSAINKGLKKASGDIVTWLNSDDFYYPGSLKLIGEMYLLNPDAGLYIGNGSIVDKNGNRIRKYSNDIIFDYNTLLRGSNYILQPSTFINAKAVKEVGYLDETLHYAMDLEYWFRIASRFNVVTVNKELSAYRWYDEIKTKTGGLKRWIEQWEIIHKYSNLQLTPGMLVEFFNVLGEKEVIDHLGLDISEISQKLKLYFYNVMQKMLNTNDCIPKHGTGDKYFPPDEDANKINNNVKKDISVNIIKSTSNNPRIDIVLPEGHSWFVREGYVDAIKHFGVFNKLFYVNAEKSNDDLFRYLKSPESDFIFLMNTEWHAQYLHNNCDWQKRWNDNNLKKILFSFECMNNPTIKRNNMWWADNISAIENAMKSVDAIVFAHEIDEELLAKYGKPVLWQPFAIDEQLFPKPKKYLDRISKGFFRGKTTPYYYEDTYSDRRKLIESLKSCKNVELFDSYQNEKGTTRERAENFIREMNDYRIVLGLPSLSPTMVVRPFEAMASGAVFFQNNIQGKRSNKLFEHRKNIIFYDKENTKNLIQQINYVLENPELGEQIAEKGYQEVLERHTIKHRINEVLDWIQHDYSIGNEKTNRSEKRQISDLKGKVLIDGVIFQLQQKFPAGISRVWSSLLYEIGKTDYAKNILLLDRGNTAPFIEGIKKRVINSYNRFYPNADAKYIEDICAEENANLFISTYYTYTESTKILLMLHDFIPELTGMDLSDPEWVSKKNAIDRASEYISVSESTKNDFKKIYSNNSHKKVLVNYNAVSDNFKLHEEKAIKEFKNKYNIQKPYYILCGQRTGYKNFIQFLKAISYLKNKDEFEIILTGGNPKIEEEFLPYLSGIKYSLLLLSDIELSTALGGAIALVYPSKYEGFGLPVLEAMKSGCPVIACRNSSIIEIAKDAAYYIKEDDIRTMQNALTVIRDSSVRNPLIKEGIENVKRFSWEKSASILIEKINELVETKPVYGVTESKKLNSIEELIYKIWSTPKLMSAYETIENQLNLGPQAELNEFLKAEKEIGAIEEKFFKNITWDNLIEKPLEAYRFFFMGIYYQKNNKWENAFKSYVLAFKLGMIHWRLGYLSSLMAVKLGNHSFPLDMLPEVLKAKSDFNEAKELLDSIMNEETFFQKTGKIKVTAIVSTYNSEKFIHGCLEDIVNQTLYAKGELEIVIINSGSKQNEEKIVNEYLSKYKNIKYIKTENETIYQAWNRGIKIASGKYITNANTDDRHGKDALEILAAELDADEQIGLVYADQYITNKENQTFEEHTIVGYFEWPDFDRIQLIHCACIGPQPMWRRSLHERFGYFDGTLRVAGDYEWWLRISEKVKLKHIPKKLGLYLLSNNSIEYRYPVEMQNETRNIRLDYAQKAHLEALDYNKYKATFLISIKCEQQLISIIIPTYNRKNKLKNAIKSVLNQTFNKFEIIIVNDAGENVTGLVEQFRDNRIKLINHSENKGLAASRNTGIKVAKGEYIALLDDDDIFYPNHLETALKYLSEDNKVVYSDAVRYMYNIPGQKIINKSVPYSIDYNRDKILIGNIAPVNCFVFRKSLIEVAGLFDESLSVLEDWDFWLRLSSFTEFKHIKESTVQVNWYEDGSTMTSSKGKDFEETRKKIYKKYQNEINKIPNVNEIINEFNSIWKNDFPVKIPLVSIIALSYNQVKFTKSFLISLLQYTDIPFELILIDNKSDKETIGYLKSFMEKDERIKIYFNSSNLGFPKGINQGIKKAKGKYIIIANNDIVLTKGWIERMIEVAESDPKIGLVGPISNSVSGLQLDKEATYTTIAEMHNYAAKIKAKNKAQTFEFPRVAFLCTLIKREVIDKIGGLDERFSPGNFEDDDFCLRAQLAGYKTVIAKDVFIHHYGSKSFAAEGPEKYRKRLETNQKIFIDKWGATPDEIWLKGKQIKGRNIMFTLDKNEFTENLQRALSLIQEKEYDIALDYLKNSVEQYNNFDHHESDPELANLLNLAGNIALLKGDVGTAQKYFENALNEDKNSPHACAGLGEILFLGENYEAAKTMYEWGVKNNPDNKAAVDGLAKVNKIFNLPENDNSLFNQNEEQNLIENSDAVNESDADKLINEAYEMFNDKRFAEALDKLSQVENIFNGQLSNPADIEFAASFYNMKGFNYLGLNDIDNAKASFQKALEINPNSSQACAGLGEVLFLNKYDEQAKIMFEKALKNNPDNLFAAKGLEKVKKILEQSVLSDANCVLKVSERNDFGKLFNQLNLLGKGAEIGVQTGGYSQILRNTWNGKELYLIDRWKYNPDYKDIANVSDERQMELYLSVVKKFANDHSVHIIRKDSVEASKQFPDAYFDWIYLDADLSYEGCTNDLEAWYPKLKEGGVLAGHDYVDGEFREGSFGVKSAVERFTKNLDIELFTTNEHLKSWYFIKPGGELSSATETKINKNTIVNEEDSQKIQSVLNEILEASYELFKLLHFSEAIETLNKSEELFYSQNNKDLISAYENMKGFNYLGLNDKVNARKSFETALNINSESSQACAGLGELFYLDGKEKEAKTMYEFAVKNNPENQYAVSGLEKINKILDYPETHNTLLNFQ